MNLLAPPQIPWLLRALAWLLGLPAAAMDRLDRRRARRSRVIYSPEFATEHEAADWLFACGATEVSLWAGPSGAIRGLGVVR